MPKSKKILEPGQEPGEKVRKLTDQQELFCLEYMKDLNATQAAIRAGYSANNADKIGSELLGKTRVKARVEEMKSKRARRLNISADRILAEISHVAFARITDVVSIESGTVRVKETDGWSQRSKAAVSEITETTNESGGSLRVKMHDKLAALEKLAKHVGLYEQESDDSNSGSKGSDFASVLDLVRAIKGT